MLKRLFLSVMLLCSALYSNTINIAVAANVSYAIDSLIAEFNITHPDTKVNVTLGSSGKLTAQIIHGAPYDIFMSANMKYPNALYEKGKSKTEPKIYAFGKLVLWSMVDSLKPSLNLLLHKNIKHIATANPKTAPYGIPTEEVLKHYKLYDSIKNKLVYGESIAQTNQFITTKAAEIGFTSKSVVLSPFIKGKGNWIDIDEQAYAPIKQGIVIIKNTSTSIDKKEKFYNFLFSKKGQDILNKFGYSTNF